MHHVSTWLQLANVFTKPLGQDIFQNLIFKLGIIDLHTPTLGGVWERWMKTIKIKFDKRLPKLL